MRSSFIDIGAEGRKPFRRAQGREPPGDSVASNTALCQEEWEDHGSLLAPLSRFRSSNCRMVAVILVDASTSR